MPTNTAQQVFKATLIHAPVLGEIQISEQALISVDEKGVITSVLETGDQAYSTLHVEAETEGRLNCLPEGQYLLPGLVDLHVHAPQWPMVGKALHLPLYEWLEKHTFPLEARYADTDFAKEVYESLVETLLANGTTTTVYFGTIHNPAKQALAEICLKRGQRAFVGKVALDDEEQYPEYYRDVSAVEAVKQTRELIDYIVSMPGNEEGLVRPIITPRFIPSCTDELLHGLGHLASETCCHVQTHCSESDWEHSYVLERCGKTDTDVLNEFGLLGRRMILAHSNHVTDQDCATIKVAGAGVAHCPLSNFYFANAVFPLRAALEKEMHVGLGTDISAGPSPSIFDSCRQAISASRLLEDGVDQRRSAGERGRENSRIDFRHAFWLATAGGGEVLDLPVGKFEAGYHFDAIAIDVKASTSPIAVWNGLDQTADVAQKIIYGATRANVARVWVNGGERGKPK